MTKQVSLRPVEAGDLPVFFLHQLDPEAARLAAFASREREAFSRHWMTNILGNPAAMSCTVLADGRIAGNVLAWTDFNANERFVGYWIGREFWGHGIASAALVQFLAIESVRPLRAHVVSHNLGSIRVLEKAGFVRIGGEVIPLPGGEAGEEYLYSLGS